MLYIAFITFLCCKKWILFLIYLQLVDALDELAGSQTHVYCNFMIICIIVVYGDILYKSISISINI
jgi:hypothetical protein